MAQVMEADLSHARAFQQTEEFQANAILIQWLALLIAKNPKRDFLPAACDGFQLSIKLQRFQGGGEFTRQVHTSRFAAFGCSHLAVCEVSADFYETPGEIDIFPLKGQEFALP